ncbi:MAG: zf-HC2 domain-containing protein [Armatimonadota bacterium]|nr:zf-HC2 domain-containing protein [Armatimonadota bacterium]
MSWHPEIGEIQSLVDGELDPRGRRSIEAHLQSCERCRRIAGRLRDLSETLRSIAPPTPPADLQGRILSAASEAPRARQLTCSECTELASAYIDGELFGSERDAFEAHVFTCEACYAALKHMERTALVIRETPRTAAPAGLRERIHAAVEVERSASVFTMRRVVGGLAGLAAAAAILAALILPRVYETRPTSPQPVIAERPVEAEAPAAETGPAVSEDRLEPAGEAELAEATPTALEAGDAPARQPSRHRSAPGTRPAAPPAPAPAAEAAPGSSAEHDSAPGRPRVTPPSATLGEDDERGATPAASDGAPVEEDADDGGPRRPERAPGPMEPAPSEEAAVGPVLASGPEMEEPAVPPTPAAEDDTVRPGASSATEGPTTDTSETALATGPRTTGPRVRAQPAPPAASSVEATSGRNPIRLAVLPTRRGTQMVIEQSPEPRAEILARHSEAVNRESRSAFDNPRTGIELR